MKALKQLLDSVGNFTSSVNLERIEANEFGGAGYIAVTLPKKDWRLAKALGCKKDGYYGWIFWDCTSNGAFDVLQDYVTKAVTQRKEENKDNEHVNTNFSIKTNWL